MALPHRRRRIALLALALALALQLAPLAGCALRRLKDDLGALAQRTLVSGSVEGMAGRKTAVVVLLREEPGGGFAPVSFAVRHDDSSFLFHCEPGRYRIAAWEDKDGNLVHDAGEPVATPAEGATLVARAGERLLTVRLRFDAARGDSLLTEVHAGGVIGRERMPLKVGERARLDDPRFSAENGVLAYWQPLTFFDRFGGGIYVLDEIDPAKVPVVFVHGAAGNPQQLGPIIDGLDRARFQAWIFQYPSGARLDTIAGGFASTLEALCRKHRIGRVAIVAHSMGGLVSRATILRLAASPTAPRVSPFITISTPFGGHEAAETGVKHSPVVIPSWVDIAPGSPFLAATIGRPLPAGTEHHMLFGYRGGSTAFTGAGDGSVTFASMLLPAIQERAASVRGFDEDHVSILASPAAIARVRAILDATVQDTKR